MERADTVAEAQQEIKEIKKLKKMQLLWGNLFMLVTFLLLSYLLGNGKILFVTWALIIFLLILTILSLYTLVTGTIIGTKNTRRIRAFDRKCWGEKKWKRNKIIEIVLYTGLGIGITALAFNTDLDSSHRNLSDFAFPFAGAWIGYNLGEIMRIAALKEQPANS
ncbi:hypothetical protein CXF77_17235 [Planococcus sp. MB-3u-09]|uniref:hypothetical protein n=1 Tax=Planococcus sp. MB-3u-03 TaxID=2058136 RepID=UPI000C33C672|nr:hypothetical protein [Planococcus sp. MB-3u-03]AUD14966.1 hypothetical protein CW734_16465 [Planococcus sp. MB-3u-03]PKG47095.1 hypothetical protein CXF66_04655 [Planococcus sp. Urea-trap-24]PKG87776.1 hypothetical protein CXF91_17555 [Planococcus sp. Urea-3u-39]PKH35434.1 hypothetical protein CXF77_17235 [Planococcus sp. MB-3u-09]